VKSKAEADDIHAQLENGGNFAKLAKQFSEDPASKNEGGKFTAQKGATVAPFDRTAFELRTGELSEPVKTQFGWHIIEALADVEDASTQPLSEVEEPISSTLLEEKKNTRINEWLEELQDRFADQVSYAPGFEPPPETETGTGETDTATTE
jgi:parvulin-like peptidyl-prolyl isomerase